MRSVVFRSTKYYEATGAALLGRFMRVSSIGRAIDFQSICCRFNSFTCNQNAKTAPVISRKAQNA